MVFAVNAQALQDPDYQKGAQFVVQEDRTFKGFPGNSIVPTLRGWSLSILFVCLLYPTSRKRNNLVRVFRMVSIGFHSLVLGMAKRQGTFVVKVSFWSLVII